MKPQHPTILRMRERYSACTATTTRGLLRYVRTHAMREYKLPLPETKTYRPVEPYLRETSKSKYDARCREVRYAAAEKTDKRLRRRLYGHLSIPAKTIAGIIARAEWVAGQRSLYRTPPDARELSVTIPIVTSSDREACEAAGVRMVRRGADWDVAPTLRRSYYEHIDGATTWRNGRAVSYTRAVNTTYVTAIGLLVVGGAAIRVHETEWRVTATDGYRLDIDSHGLRVVHIATGDDYHPTLAQWWQTRTTGVADFSAAIAALREQRARVDAANARIAAEREARIDAVIAACHENLQVCVSDSLRAGNCAVGTLGFARANGIDPRRHVPVTVLTRLARTLPVPETVDRLLRVLSVASDRYTAELTRGYSLLEEHR